MGFNVKNGIAMPLPTNDATRALARDGGAFPLHVSQAKDENGD